MDTTEMATTCAQQNCGQQIYILCRYVILGNHDYGDKCYDEPPGCYVYGGESFYSPLHQVPTLSLPRRASQIAGLQVLLRLSFGSLATAT